MIARTRNRPWAFSLTELLVSMGILTLLLSLILPAVSSVREAARSTLCKSRLKELSLATHQYAEVYRCLPRPQYSQDQRDPNVVSLNWDQATIPSIHLQILAYLDPPTAETVNWAVPFQTSGGTIPQFFPAHETLASHMVGGFLCPSDSISRPGACNFRGTMGVGPLLKQTPEFFDSGNGAFANERAMPRLLQATDGLSRTAMFSERVLGTSGTTNPTSVRDAKSLPGATPRSAAALVVACATLATDADAKPFVYSGNTWLLGGADHTLYSHALPPNSGVMDCLRFGTTIPMGAASARSTHPGVVNLAMMDGSVTTINDSVSLAIWRAIATRDGLETDSTH